MSKDKPKAKVGDRVTMRGVVTGVHPVGAHQAAYYTVVLDGAPEDRGGSSNAFVWPEEIEVQP